MIVWKGNFLLLICIVFLSYGNCQLIGSRGVFTLPEGSEWRDTDTLSASEEAGRFARSFQRQAEHAAETNRRFAAHVPQESPRFYTSGSGAGLAGRKMTDLEIFDFTDSRYVDPLPETRENKPNAELEAERAALNGVGRFPGSTVFSSGYQAPIQPTQAPAPYVQTASYQPAAVAYQPAAAPFQPAAVAFPAQAAVAYRPAAAVAFHPDGVTVGAAVQPAVSLGGSGNYLNLPSSPSHSFSSNFEVGSGAKTTTYVNPGYPQPGSVNYYSLNNKQIY